MASSTALTATQLRDNNPSGGQIAANLTGNIALALGDSVTASLGDRVSTGVDQRSLLAKAQFQ